MIKMHDYIGVDFWSQMSWNRDIANLQTFIDKEHDTIYNFNESFFYYVYVSYTHLLTLYDNIIIGMLQQIITCI